jgi:hypothetical protein
MKLPPSAEIGKSAGEAIQSLLGEAKPKKVNPYWPYRSKTEADFAVHLATLAAPGVAVWYERVTFVLTPPSEHQKGVRYTPDFTVWDEGKLLSVFEVKGYWMDGAKEKVKQLAYMLRPTSVYVAQKRNGVWAMERF